MTDPRADQGAARSRLRDALAVHLISIYGHYDREADFGVADIRADELLKGVATDSALHKAFIEYLLPVETLAAALRLVEMTPVTLGPEADGSLAEFEWQAAAILAALTVTK
jgi:hypothetical protein